MVNKIVFLLCVISLPVFASESLKDIIEKSYTNSPIIKKMDGNIESAKDAEKLISSYHYPVFNFSQIAMSSNNPVNVFAFKLQQENFSMNDLNIDSLNNPASRINHQSSFTLSIPIYAGGQIIRKYESASLQRESMEIQKIWIKKVLRKNIYGLYYSILNLDEMNEFLNEESKYLEKILRSYDAKSSENKNRYLSYNKGKIIKENIEQAKEELRLTTDKMLQDIKFLSGENDLNLNDLDKNSEDILVNIDWKNIDQQSVQREDLASLEKYVSAMHKEVSSEKSKYLPSIGAFANYSLYTEKFNNFGKDYTVGIKLSWDLSIGSFRTVDFAESKRTVAELEYQEQKLKTKTELSKLKDDLLNLESKITRSDNMHKIFQENKKILSSQYLKGSIDLYNLLDNFAHYIENKGNLHRLKSEFKMKQIEFVDNYQKI